MQFSTIYTHVESLSNVTSQRSLIKQAIQIGLYKATAKDLPYLMSDGFVTTVAPYETGTVTVTNGSTTVTGSATTFTAAMVGRKFRVSGQNAYYRISAFVSTTEVTLEVAFQGTTASAQSYSIFKDEYRLPADLDAYKVMRQIEDANSLVDIENTAFDLINPAPRAEGSPRVSILSGSKLDTYTTGTVSVTVNQSTVTGSGTSWATLEGLGRGSKITIGTNVYTVKSVDSATQITIYENASATASASTYTISLDNYLIQFEPIPDTAENIYFKYQRLPYPLVDDEDVPDLPDQWHHVLVTAGLIWAWKVKDKDESVRTELMFNEEIKVMWERIGFVSKNRSRPRASQDDLFNNFGSVRLPSGYGIPIKL